MKKKQISTGKKLNLDKETLSKLSDDQLNKIDGGVTVGSLTCGKSEQDDDEMSCLACSCNGAAAPAQAAKA
ncbi:class I lanthipeptide [Arcicella aquatica]|uniref:Class I lanthipeptide n=1 Tax=Arcicella aquatica TaxID=217141 RepID=A0ABU5QND8_9BACT|nr:class I lanthipeptide [Arcicella aquatica]MEA5257946.1 class I lanthipeptide [Arcicella aquatica]